MPSPTFLILDTLDTILHDFPYLRSRILLCDSLHFCQRIVLNPRQDHIHRPNSHARTREQRQRQVAVHIYQLAINRSSNKAPDQYNLAADPVSAMEGARELTQRTKRP